MKSLAMGIVAFLLTGAAVNDPLGLRFDSRELDLGALHDIKEIERDLVFENATSGTVSIVRVKSSCGCTSSEAMPKNVGAHGKGLLNLKIRPSIGGRRISLYIVDAEKRLFFTPRGSSRGLERVFRVPQPMRYPAADAITPRRARTPAGVCAG